MVKWSSRNEGFEDTKKHKGKTGDLRPFHENKLPAHAVNLEQVHRLERPTDPSVLLKE